MRRRLKISSSFLLYAHLLGNPLFDLARFLCISADADIRRGCERVAIDAYYDRIVENYAKHNATLQFSRQEVKLRMIVAFAGIRAKYLAAHNLKAQNISMRTYKLEKF